MTRHGGAETREYKSGGFVADYFQDSISKQVDGYLLSLLPERDPVLQKMETYAIERGFPFIGPLVGPLLALLAKAIHAKTVFELGSGFGFSAVHFARALPEGGKVICTDGDPENAKLAKQFFAEAGIADRVDFRVGDAISVLSQFPGPFDIVLMDIDKHGYPDGFRAAWPKLKVGGLFITDNLLWHGRVWNDDNAATTQGVREYTRLIYDTPGAHSVVLPLRDGVAVTLKTG
jgi:predicted O-methyltransferase YrrM